MSILDKLKKRRCYPVGDSGIFVRSLSIGEIERLKALAEDLKLGFSMGCALVDEKGNAEFSPATDESDADFAKRVLAGLADVDTETIAECSQAIGKIGKVPEVQAIEKNSQTTAIAS